MKNKINFLSAHESYLLGGLAAIIGIALLPLLLGVSLSFEFAIVYWVTVIIFTIILASFILFRQSKEIKKSEDQIRMYEDIVKKMKRKKEQAIN
ncbi:MAG: hypothetical protein EAZ08_09290 [Cytophagales bacterium]|nr:MAG: hypothetical protein EAZ08_09290 [Cytophagales bacterium]